MIEPISWLTVIGLALAAFILIMQWWTKRQDSSQKRTDEIDKQIDQAINASDIINVSGKLRDKK